MNYLDYYIHQLYDPSYYHRQYENDLPQPKKKDESSLCSRAVHIALPFISLYQPIGRLLSLSMGSVRVANNGLQTFTAETHFARLIALSQVAIAAIALGATLYQNTLGLAVTSVVDITTNLYHIGGFLITGDFGSAAEESVQALSSALYLAIMATGSLEVVLVSVLIQSTFSFYQAKNEWNEGRIPEVIAKVVMGSIRGLQVKTQWNQIQRRNELQRNYAEMMNNLSKGRKIDHLWDHPLINQTTQSLDPNHPLKDLSKQIDEHRVILEDATGTKYDFGSHFHGYGKQTVKGMNITFKTDGEKTSLDFKINHVFRDRLEKTIETITKMPERDLLDIWKLSSSHIEGISVERVGNLHPFSGIYLGEKYCVHLAGLGSISFGADREVTTNYNKIHVEMEKGKTLYDFHEALSFLALDDVLRQSAKEDIEKMKLGMLYRAFCPTNATIFERSELYFELDLPAFKEEILRQSPEMEVIIDRYLHRMVLREILPGKMRFSIEGLGEELKERGARGLTSVLTGSYDDERMFERVASILKMGMLSSEMRNENGFGNQGLSWGIDYYTGGADSVFTQIVTDKMEDFDESLYWGDLRLNFNPKVLETGTYQYHYDNFGTRILPGEENWWFNYEYLERQNIFNFLTAERFAYSGANEVMIKDRIAPDYISSIVVRDEIMKKNLLEYLRNKGLVQVNTEGHETILGKLADSFIFGSWEVKDEQFA